MLVANSNSMTAKNRLSCATWMRCAVRAPQGAMLMLARDTMIKPGR